MITTSLVVVSDTLTGTAKPLMLTKLYVPTTGSTVGLVDELLPQEDKKIAKATIAKLIIL